MDQWPLSQEKLHAIHSLVVEQLQQGQIESCTNPRNTIFATKKKSGKWCLLQNLRGYKLKHGNHGSFTAWTSFPCCSPFIFSPFFLDLKDCFFTIPLHPSDQKRFASPNFHTPMVWYHWKVLPQGMANRPTLCQKFVAQTILPIQLQKSHKLISSTLFNSSGC